MGQAFVAIIDRADEDRPTALRCQVQALTFQDKHLSRSGQEGSRANTRQRVGL